MRYAMAIVALIAVIFTSKSFANEHIDLVRMQLAEAQSGHVETHGKKFGSLEDGRYQTLSYRLNAGTSYAFFGRCDGDCSDLDLILHDENGSIVDQDLDYDDIPVVTVTPRRSANFRLRVDMASCGADPCFYGVSAVRVRNR